MSVEFFRGSPGKFDSRTLIRKTLSRWTGRITIEAAFLATLSLTGGIREHPSTIVALSLTL